jgi:hypothetical protein
MNMFQSFKPRVALWLRFKPFKPSEVCPETNGWHVFFLPLVLSCETGGGASLNSTSGEFGTAGSEE